MRPDFWRGKRVFLTGHTGFKGSWMSAWLARTGADVTGYALAPPTSPNLFEAAGVARSMRSLTGDIRDAAVLRDALADARPDVVFHLAAQSLVRQSYENPLETYEVNVVGTAALLDAVRHCPSVRVVVVVTSDKCYENREWDWPYRESDPMGGHDPYSSSKGCAELVTSAYARSFFRDGNVRIATARAGNVIGGGDWAKDRLVPDIVTAFGAGRAVVIRNPDAIRPWQHVLEPLNGYALLAERLYEDPSFAGPWNFGPSEDDTRPVRWILDELVQRWGGSASWTQDPQRGPHEAHFLTLDSSRARRRLGWQPRLHLREALAWVGDWYKEFARNPAAAPDLVARDLQRYEALAA